MSLAKRLAERRSIELFGDDYLSDERLDVIQALASGNTSEVETCSVCGTLKHINVMCSDGICHSCSDCIEEDIVG